MKTDNILIAEFYTECEFEDRGNGWYSKIPSGKWASPRDEKTNALFNNHPLSNGEAIKYMVYEPLLKFHIFWDCLMPVVEKINTIDEYCFSVYIQYCLTTIHQKNTLIIEKQGYETIEATYKAVVEFIKWYNKNNADENQ